MRSTQPRLHARLRVRPHAIDPATVLAAAAALLCGGAAQAQSYVVSYTGIVDSTNACTYLSSTDCYARVGATFSGSFTYTTGPADLTSPTGWYYKNLMTAYSVALPGIGYSGSYANAAGFGRFTTSRDAPTEAGSTFSVFSAYVAQDPGNYTYVPDTNTVTIGPRVPTAVAVAGDNFYGDLKVAEVRVNFVAASTLFANLAVPTTFTAAQLDPAFSNFGVSLQSDTAFSNNAGYGFGGGITSVTVTPVSAVPEAGTAALMWAGLGAVGLLVSRRRFSR